MIGAKLELSVIAVTIPLVCCQCGKTYRPHNVSERWLHHAIILHISWYKHTQIKAYH